MFKLLKTLLGINSESKKEILQGIVTDAFYFSVVDMYDSVYLLIKLPNGLIVRHRMSYVDLKQLSESLEKDLLANYWGRERELKEIIVGHRLKFLAINKFFGIKIVDGSFNLVA